MFYGGSCHLYVCVCPNQNKNQKRKKVWILFNHYHGGNQSSMAGWLVSLNLVEEKTISGENLIKVFSINWLFPFIVLFRIENVMKNYVIVWKTRERERETTTKICRQTKNKTPYDQLAIRILMVFFPAGWLDSCFS